METLFQSKAITTNKLSKEEAQAWFAELQVHTDILLKKEFPWVVKNKLWPLKAQKKNAGQKDPVFAVIHHTSNKQGNYKPAFNRFTASSMASSHFLIGRKLEELLYLVPIENLSYHAVKRTWLPLSVQRLLKVENGFLNEVGTEVAGNGGTLLFSYEQLLNVIVLHRYLLAMFPTLKEIKSHRFFSPTSRKGDPGPLFFLPLIEHAIFNDVDLNDANYWLHNYKNDAIEFANNALGWMSKYGVLERDEWVKERRIVTNKNLLEQ